MNMQINNQIPTRILKVEVQPIDTQVTPQEVNASTGEKNAPSQKSSTVYTPNAPNTGEPKNTYETFSAKYRELSTVSSKISSILGMDIKGNNVDTSSGYPAEFVAIMREHHNLYHEYNGKFKTNKITPDEVQTYLNKANEILAKFNELLAKIQSAGAPTGSPSVPTNTLPAPTVTTGWVPMYPTAS